METDTMKEWHKAIINAVLFACMTALPLFMAYDEIDYSMAKAIIWTFAGAFIMQSLRFFKPPEKDVNDDDIDGKKPPVKKDIVLGLLAVI